MNLKVKVGKLVLKNPVMAASGTFGSEYGGIVDINKLGAYIAKTITIDGRIGNPPPRIIETASGMLNAIGLENGGVEDFIENKLSRLRNIKIPIIASIAGDDAWQFKALAKSLSKTRKVSGLEVNLSCPNVKHGKRDFLIAQDKDATYEVIKAVRSVTNITMIAKLSPNVTDVALIAEAARKAGADAVSLVNTFIGMAVDIDRQKPVLGNVTGGLSGPAIKPLALRMVREVYKKVKIPIIGMGGIMDHKDAVEFMLCGASAVQVGTANFVDPSAMPDIIKGLKSYMSAKGIKYVRELTGALKA